MWLWLCCTLICVVWCCWHGLIAVLMNLVVCVLDVYLLGFGVDLLGVLFLIADLL